MHTARDESSEAGEYYSSDVPWWEIPRTWERNGLSLENSGGSPGVFTKIDDPINQASWYAWTIEAYLKANDLSGHRTFIGRDGQNIAHANGAHAAMYFKASSAGDAAPCITFVNQSSNIVVVTSSQKISTGRWYHIAAVSDGTTLKLYLDDLTVEGGSELVGSLTYPLDTPNSALKPGLEGNNRWSLFRGMYNGIHADRFSGKLDEVRVSSSALPVSEFLNFKKSRPQGMTILVQ